MEEKKLTQKYRAIRANNKKLNKCIYWNDIKYKEHQQRRWEEIKLIKKRSFECKFEGSLTINTIIIIFI